MRIILGRRGQMRIQQMTFMIVAVFFFFVLVGLGFVSYQVKSSKGGFEDLQKEKAVESLQTLTNMPELTCGALCLDEDKLEIVSKMPEYKEIWPVQSIKVYKIFPAFNRTILCPNVNCNFYQLYDSGQKNLKEYSTFISLCKKIKEAGYVYTKCEMGSLVVGVKLIENE